MSDELIIKIKGDNSPWNQAVDRSKAGARGLADEQSRQAQRAAKEIQRQAKIATDAATKERERETREAIREFDRILKENLKAGAAAAREAKKAADVAISEQKRGADSIAREAQRQADAQIREQKKWERANVISIGTVQAAGIKYQDRLRTDAEKAAAAQVRAAQKAAKAQQDGFSLSSSAGGQFMGVLHSIAGEFALFNVGRMAIDAVADAFRKAREQAYDSARFVQEYRESLLEIAALRDRLGGTTKETTEQLAFRAQTLQGQDAARAFQETYLGSGEAAVKAGLISPAESQRLAVLGGSFQAVEGGDAATHGRLAGMLPQITGGQLKTAEELFGKEQQIYQVMKPGSFQKFSQGVDQLLSVSGYAQPGVGAYKDIAQEAAVLSAFSTINPAEAGSLTEQFTRATIGSQGRLKGPKIEGADAEKVGKYLKNLGVTDQMDAVGIGNLIAQDMGTAEQKEISGGRSFNAYNYLLKHGYSNQQERDALINYFSLKKSGLMDDTFMKAAAAPIDAVTAQADIAKWQHSDPLARGRRAQISEAAAQATIGMGGMEDYMNLQRQAFNALTATGQLGGDYDYNAKDFTWGGNTAIQRKLFATMADQARAHGIDASRKYGKRDAKTGLPVEDSAYWDFGKLGSVNESQFWWMNDRDRAQKLAGINAGISGAGGDVSAALLRELLAEQKKANDLAQKQIDQANQGVPVRQAVAGPAPAGRRP